MAMNLTMKLSSWRFPAQRTIPRLQQLRNRYYIAVQPHHASFCSWSSWNAFKHSQSLIRRQQLGTGSCHSPCLQPFQVVHDNASSTLQFNFSSADMKMLSGKPDRCFSSISVREDKRSCQHKRGVFSKVIAAHELAKQAGGSCEIQGTHFDPASESFENEEAEGSLGVAVSKIRSSLRLWGIEKSKEIDYSEILFVADYLERFGLDLYFRQEIKSILYHVFKLWTESSSLSETAAILGDLENVALAFYLLRSHQYDVQPNIFQLYRREDGKFYKRPHQTADQGDGGQPNDSTAGVADLLNLIRASGLKFRCDTGLQDAYKFASTTLRSMLDGAGEGGHLSGKTAAEVRYRLKYPWAINLRLLEARQSISTFQTESVTARFPNSDRLSSKVLSLMLSTAVNLVNGYISELQREIEALKRWDKESGMEMVNMRSKQVILPAYLGIAYDMPQAKYAYTREISAKILYFFIVLDDVYDAALVSTDHLAVFTDAVKRWDPSVLEKLPKDEGLMPVRVIFKELYDQVNAWAKLSSVWYGRDLLQSFIRHWVVRLEVFMSERIMLETNYKMTFDEFVNEFAKWSFGTETVTPLTYYSIPWGKMSPTFFETRPDMNAVFAIAKTARFFNDARSHEHEKFTESQGRRDFVHIVVEENPQLGEKEAVEWVEQYAQLALEETTEEVLRTCIPYPGVKDVLLAQFRTSVLLYYFVDGCRSTDHPLGHLIERLPDLSHLQTIQSSDQSITEKV